MNKKLMIGIAVGFVLVAGIAAARNGGSEPSPDRWAKMRKKMEEMPEDFPPRVMFDNVAATRANTDQILALLRNGSSARAGDHTTAVN
jgi:hypothetical protein